jgi:hypothetical protein
LNDNSFKLRVTFFHSELFLQAIYTRLSSLENENVRARAIRALLSQVLETRQVPAWLLSVPEQKASLPRSITVRLNLSCNDPSLHPVIAQLRERPEDERAAWVKNLMVECLGFGPNTATSSPSPRTAENIQKAMVVSPVPEVQERVEEQPTENTPATDDPARTRLFKNALKAFDLDLLQNSPT